MTRDFHYTCTWKKSLIFAQNISYPTTQKPTMNSLIPQLQVSGWAHAPMHYMCQLMLIDSCGRGIYCYEGGIIMCITTMFMYKS